MNDWNSHMEERRGVNKDVGDLYPTSNLLIRWFSPDLLERTRAGKVRNIPSASATSHISLEEIARHKAS